MAQLDRGLDPANPDIQWSDHDPRGIVLRGPAKWDARVDVPMGLIAYVDRGVDPHGFDATSVRDTALEDARDFQWTVSGPAGRVEQSDTGAGIPRWAFIATEPGDYRISVRWGPFMSDSIKVRVKAGKWKPIGVVLERSAGQLKQARVGEDYSLVARLEYENVDPRFVDQKTRGEDARYLTVKAGKQINVEIPGLVRPQPGRFFGLKPVGFWWFKAPEPGDYVAWAEWRPQEGQGLDSTSLPIRVVSEFTGKYTGSVRYQAKPGTMPRMSKLEFAVDADNQVKGTFSFGDSEEFYNGTFDGSVERVDGFSFFVDGRLDGTGSMTRDLKQLPPELLQLVETAQEIIRQMRALARSSTGDAGGDAILRDLDNQLDTIWGSGGDAQLEALRQQLRDAGVDGGPQSVTIRMDLRDVGGIVNAQGSLSTQSGDFPVTAHSFQLSQP